MAFSEKIKYEIRKKALHRCCICHNIGVEIHHIIPQAENGPDTFKNGAPLCPSCHETYGANPTKRKFIREARDIWYEICENRYTHSEKRLDNIEDSLSELKALLIENFEFKAKIENKKFLTFGEILNFYFKQSVANEKDFKFCYGLIFFTFGEENNNEDNYFNQFRDSFIEIFGILLSEKIIAYSMKSSEIDWSKGFTESEIQSLFNICYTNMLLVFMQFDYESDEKKLGVQISDDNNDLIYSIIK
ncbi:HNH endonuclease signature motif containing protein [uncultured Aquimarina sp.]|uniref:HNH endonuclease n=1 Tax=uncultured Aquimarina sp. TaxID=575652 RepID=UPI002637F2A8|nr:HNH endonuclease signature motif containing protein [uncultured Aquimarina sp.]